MKPEQTLSKPWAIPNRVGPILDQYTTGRHPWHGGYYMHVYVYIIYIYTHTHIHIHLYTTCNNVYLPILYNTAKLLLDKGMQSQPFFPASEADAGGQAPIVRDGGIQNLRSLHSSQLSRQIPSRITGEN